LDHLDVTGNPESPHRRGGIGPPLYGAFSRVLGEGLGAIATCVTVGPVTGGIGAAITGGNVLEGVAGGAITAALVAAATYAGYRAWESLTTPGGSHTAEHIREIAAAISARASADQGASRLVS
jgi:hypothetical protein